MSDGHHPVSLAPAPTGPWASRKIGTGPDRHATSLIACCGCSRRAFDRTRFVSPAPCPGQSEPAPISSTMRLAMLQPRSFNAAPLDFGQSRERLWSAMPLHRFLWEFQRSLATSCASENAFQHLTLVIDSPPKVVRHFFDLPLDVIQVPVAISAHRFHRLAPDFGSEHQTEPVPPVLHVVGRWPGTLSHTKRSSSDTTSQTRTIEIGRGAAAACPDGGLRCFRFEALLSARHICPPSAPMEQFSMIA